MRTSIKAASFTESVIREMTRVFLARGDGPGVNLAQGFPDFPAPEDMKQAACEAIQKDINQYAIAGIFNERRIVLGLMPHPERATNDRLGSSDGLQVVNALSSFARL